MDNRVVYISAVIDGFGATAGDTAENLARREIGIYRYDLDRPVDSLRGALRAVDVELRRDPMVRMDDAGVSVALTMFLPDEGELYVATVGNCRVLLVRDKRVVFKSAVHHWNEAAEYGRGTALNERSENEEKPCWLDTTKQPAEMVHQPSTTLPHTAKRSPLSRALGPVRMRECGMTSDPDITMLAIKPGRDRMIMGTSGVWKVFDPDGTMEQLLGEFPESAADDGMRFGKAVIGLFEDEAKALEARLARFSGRAPREVPYPDNATLVVQSFKYEVDRRHYQHRPVYPPPSASPPSSPRSSSLSSSAAAAAAAAAPSPPPSPRSSTSSAPPRSVQQ